MLKCSETECTLYSKDGSRKLGTYPFSEHGGEEGARKAAGKQEKRAVMFREMKKSLADAVDEFGAQATLDYVIKAFGSDDFDVEKAKRRKVRRVTIEDEDDDGDEEKKAAPPPPEDRGETGEEGARPTPKAAEKEGEERGKLAQEEGELPEGWTSESIAKYWESLGGSVESCVAKAPDTVKDKQRFCTRLQAKVGAAGDKAAGEKPSEEGKPAPPVAKSADEFLNDLAELIVEKALVTKYKGEVGWDDPRSWLGEGKDAGEIRKRAWEGMGGSVTGCIAKVKGKVDDPGAFCASLKDKVTGTTMWRGKKGKEEEAVIGKSVNDLEALDELLYGDETDWDEAIKSLPEWDITVVKEKSVEDDTDVGLASSEEEDRPTFRDLVCKSAQRRTDAIVDGLVEELRDELEVE
jgi:hypothetical protein